MKYFAIILLIFFSLLLYGEDISVKAHTGASFLLTGSPVIPVKTGVSGFLGGEYFLRESGLFFDGGLGYDYTGIGDSLTLSMLSLSAGAGYRAGVGSGFSFYGALSPGYFIGNISNGTIGSNPFLKAQAGVEYRFPGDFNLGLDVNYRYLFGFYSNLQASLTARYILPLTRETNIDYLPEVKPRPLKNALGIYKLKLNDVFPVFYKYYDQNSIGKAVLLNRDRGTAENIRISFFVKDFMDYPKEIDVPGSLKQGQGMEIDLFSLFSSKILDLSEGTKVFANIKVTYTMEREEKSSEIAETLRIYDRNAMTWDDDRKAAAFVTAKNSTVLKWSKQIAGLIKENNRNSFNPNLLSVMAINQALNLYGINYVVDPSTPYKDFSLDAAAVDYLQFPIQTIDYKAGDCDDLSILYAALLEAIGVKSAFVTTPGHIYIAVSLDITKAMARKTFSRHEDFIYIDDNAWLPFEVTMINSGFDKAWQQGAKFWKEYEAQGTAGFFPVETAWSIYEPVGFLSGGSEPDMPEKSRMVKSFLGELDAFINRELYPLKEKYLASLAKGENPKDRNSLGVLYAQYGKFAEAEKEFKKILTSGEFVPALINLGNIYFLQEQMGKALDYYNKALIKQPENPIILLSIAKVNYEMENYSKSQLAYNKLKELNATIAEKYSYLAFKNGEGSRASDIIRIKGEVLWDDEE